MARCRPTEIEQLLDTALLIADEVGVAHVDIHAVATVAGVARRTLQEHFASDDALRDAMAGELTRRVYQAANVSTWQGSLSALCHELSKVLLEHPQWIGLVTRTAAVPDLPSREYLLAQMKAAGFKPEQALAGVVSAGLLTLGVVMHELQRQESERRHAVEIDTSCDDGEQAPSSAIVPVGRVEARAVASISFQETLSTALDAFIAGLAPHVHQ